MLEFLKTTRPEQKKDDVLQRRVADIDRRLAELDAVVKTLGPQSYRAQELAAERTDLLRIRRETVNALHEPEPDARQLERRAQRRRVIDAMEREQRESAEHFIARLEAQGDYRQARIWRMHVLGIRERLEALIPH